MSPGRIDPTNPVWNSSRKPSVGEFTFNGKPVFVIANHFDAKLGDQNADGRFQFPAQSSAVQRSGQAQAEHDFVEKILAIDKKADVVALGDLNDYQVQSRAVGPADRHGRRIGRLDPDRPNQHAAGRSALHLRLRRHLGGARPHPGHARARQPAVPGRAHQLRVRRPGLRPRPAGRATQAVARSRPGGRLEPISRPPEGPTVARFSALAVGVAQLVELLVVVQAVGGSSPLAHPLRKASISGAFLLVGDVGWLVRRRRCTTSLYHLAAFGCVDDIPSFPATTRAGLWCVPPRRQGRASGLRCAHR